MREFNINIRHIRHKDRLWLADRVNEDQSNSKINVSLMPTQFAAFTNGESFPSYLIKFDKTKLTTEKYPPEDIPHTIIAACYLAMDMGYSEFYVTGHGAVFPYLPYYDYNVPTETTPAHTIEYCMQGGNYLYIKNIAEEL